MAGGKGMLEVKTTREKTPRGNRAIRLSECGGEQGEACQTTTERGREGGGQGRRRGRQNEVRGFVRPVVGGSNKAC